MFKKTLAAVAVLGAFAGSAMAANVTLYGVVDNALNYTYLKAGSAESKDTYGMKSGAAAGNRWGLKGQEELGNGLVAGFQLESGFTSDDGRSAQDNRLFGRVASLYLKGGFGTLAVGHDGALVSGLGSVSYIYQYAAFGTGWGSTVGAQGLYNFGVQDRADNAVTYITPDFGGLKLYAQYSFQTAGQELPDSGDNTRYAALGAQYIAGPFSTGLVVDNLFKPTDADDQFTVSYGASYDFGVAKVMGMAQYGDHMDAFGSNTDVLGKGVKLFKGDLKGWNLGLGATAPLAGGTFYGQVNYVAVKNDVTDKKLDGYGLGLGYGYPLSKRTTVFTYGGYGQFKDKAADVKTKIGEVGLGLTHKF
ncbi:MAG: porin [Sutterella sp.]|nr:porin [Sutterella sp.]